MARKLTTEDKILHAKTIMNGAQRGIPDKEKLYTPFYAYIISQMTCHNYKSDNLPTMGVNQYGHLYYNEDFVNQLTEDQLVAVLCHEASHVSTLTFQRQKGRIAELWNMATDAVINQLISAEGFQLPPNGIIPRDGKLKFNGYKIQIDGRCAEEVYEDMYRLAKKRGEELMKNGKGKNQNKKGKDKNGGGAADPNADPGDSGMDVALIPGTDQVEGDKDKGFDKHLKDDLDPDGNHSEGEGEGEGGDGDGNCNREKRKGPSASDRAKNEKKWRSALAGAVAAHKRSEKGRSSNLVAFYEREFNQISESTIDWKNKLQRFMTGSLPCDFTMRKPGRKSQGAGYYFPSIVKDGLNVNIGIDMSGSISNEEYNLFMSEVVAITKGFPQINLTLIPWASEVKADDIQTFSRMNMNSIFDWKSSCCGGTDLSCFADYLENNPNEYTTFNQDSINIIFTDGYVEENPKLPDCNKTLVVLTDPRNKHIFEGRCEVVVLDTPHKSDDI